MKSYSLFSVLGYSFIGLFIYLFISLSQAEAAGKFLANYDVSYAIAPSGVTIVTQTVSLINQETNLYPKQYSIILDTINIRTIIARDDGGTITPTITQTNGKTEILLTFNKQIVGIGKQLTFTLRYENADIAQKNGNIWEVTIPGISDDPDLGTYNVTLQVPPTFGKNAYLSPLPADGKHWNRAQMTKGGISAAYGESQFAKLTLRYFLDNTHVTPVTQEIAIPPDTSFQRVSIDSLTPKPQEITKDADGNWLARYTLQPGQKLPIQAGISVTLTRTPRSDYQKPIDQDISEYLKPLPFWESGDESIKALALVYKTPKDIYDYVVGTLTYDYERVKETTTRKGAREALKTPKNSICMEFTDLFIAIARAASIPAREVVGYAHTTNAKLRPLSLVSDVLHAWPEYYDTTQHLWIPVDPTWGNTTGGVDYFSKFDFNHIVFAIHGNSSTQPFPAGFYRESGKEGKDVAVEFLVSSEGATAPSLIPRIEFPSVVTAGFTARGSVLVENISGVEAQAISVSLTSSPFPYTLSQTNLTIAPYSTFTIPIIISIPSATPRGKGMLTVTAGDQIVQRSFDIQPIAWLYIALSGMIGSIAVLLWIFIMRPFHKKHSKKH